MASEGPNQAASATAEPSPSDRVLTVPNIISFARLLLVPVFAACIVTERDLAALAILALAGISDWADGVLARRLDQTSALGRLLDPAADRLYIAAALLGLAWRDVIPWWLVGVLVAREVAVASLLPALRRRGYGPLPVHLVGKGGTAMLMYAFPLLLLGEVDGFLGMAAWVFGWATALWGVALYWFAGVLYLRQAAGLIRAEPRVAA